MGEKNMRIVFLGSGEFAVPTLRWLAQSGQEAPLVVTQPARTAGRGRKVAPTPVAVAARSLGMDLLEVENVNEPDMVRRIADVRPRLGLVVAFGQKIGAQLLSIPFGGFVNLHASLLPRYRGAAPINWAIARGEERTGCTVFRLVERMDAGPILSSRWTLIKPEETADELHDRLAGIGVDAVQAALALFADDHVPSGEPQIDAEATLAPKLRKSDGVIDFRRPARDVVRHVLAMTSWPGASTTYRSKDGRWERVLVCRARVAEDPARADLPVGTLDSRLLVAARDRFIEILELKPSSGRMMTWPEYVNGRHVSAGDRFTPSPEE